MADDNSPEIEDETPAEAEGEDSKPAVPATPPRPTSQLTRPTDAVARPGFRNPSNKGTKVMRTNKKKKHGKKAKR